MFHFKAGVRKAKTLGRVLYWGSNFILIAGLAFMVHPEGYAKARHYRDTHVVVSLSESAEIRDLAKNLTPSDFQGIKCLAVNSYFEARGEGDGGMERVDDVVLNRAASGRFPDGICQVVYQTRLTPDGNPSHNGCQFSWYCDGKPHEIKDHLAYQEAYDIAYNKYVYRKAGLMPDKTGGATHYHNETVSPKWKLSFIGQFGHHLFYR